MASTLFDRKLAIAFAQKLSRPPFCCRFLLMSVVCFAGRNSVAAFPDENREVALVQATSAVRQALDAPTHLVLNGTESAGDFAAMIARRHHVSVMIMEYDLQQAGVRTDRLPTMKSEGRTLRQFIEQWLTVATASAQWMPEVVDHNGMLTIRVRLEHDKPLAKHQPNQDDARRTSFTGTVMDAAGQPAAAAVVEVRNVMTTTVTIADAAGHFEFPSPTSIPESSLIIAHDATGANMGVWAKNESPDGKFPTKVAVKVALKPTRKQTVTVVDAKGQPVPQAQVALLCSWKASFTQVTGASGTVTYTLPADMPVASVAAIADGFGADFVEFTPDTELMTKPKLASELPETVSLKLAGTKPVTLQLRDDDGKPVAGVSVAPWLLYRQDGGPKGKVDTFNLGMAAGFGSARTNAEGLVTFAWLPNWQALSWTFWPNAGEGFTRNRIEIDPKSAGTDPVAVTIKRLVLLSGRVTDADDKPVAKVAIAATGAGYSFSQFHGSAVTDEAGEYRLDVAPDQLYLVTATTEDGKHAGMLDGFVVLAGKPVGDANIQVQPTVRVFGHVTRGSNRDPVANQRIMLQLKGRGLHELEGITLPNPDNSRSAIMSVVQNYRQTDRTGHFEFIAGPGNYALWGPDQTKVEQFTIADATPREINFHTERPDTGRFVGQVVAGEPPKPVSLARVNIKARSGRANRGSWIDIKTDANGRVEVDRALTLANFYAITPDGSLAGLMELQPDDTEAILTLKPTAKVTIRLLDEDKEPLAADTAFKWGVNVTFGDRTFSTMYGGNVSTNAEGRITLENMLVGVSHIVDIELEKNRSWRTVVTFTPDAPGEQTIPDVIVPPHREYKPPTLEERVASAFERPQTPKERFAAVMKDIPLSRQLGLLIVADPKAAETISLFRRLYESRNVRKVADNYRQLALPLTGKFAASVRELVDSLGVTLKDQSLPLLILVDAEGKVVRLISEELFMTRDETLSADEERLIALLKEHAMSPLDSRQLLADALAKAKIENKRVLMQQTATWCGPCWMLSRFLDRQRAVWEKDYIWVKFDERWTYNEDVVKPLRKEAEGGIPWSAILDADGNVLITSNTADGKNIGFPSTSEPEGIKHLLKMFGTTGLRLTEEDLDILKKDLETPRK